MVIRIRYSRAAALRLITNAALAIGLVSSIGLIALVALLALQSHEMSRAILEFREVIEGIGYP